MTIGTQNSEPSAAMSLAALSKDERDEFFELMGPARMAELRWEWPFWARPSQLEPPGHWNTWMAMAGRGFGKTRLGAEWIRQQVCGETPLSPGKCSRVALVAETAADARDVIVQGPSGILAVHHPDFRPRYVKSDRCLYWPNGAIALLFSAEDPEQLRGPEHDVAWSDETGKWRYAQDTWDMLQFGLRIGDFPRQLITTTPRPIPLIKELFKKAKETDEVFLTSGSTFDNAANLAPSFLSKMRERYDKTTLGKQELYAQILDDVAGALWTRELLELRSFLNGRGALMSDGEKLPKMSRVVVGVDPSGSDGKKETADEIGIVTVGKGIDGNFYVLEDMTANMGPSAWARAAVNQYHYYQADAVVGETNYGGAMVENTVRMVDMNVNFKRVTASKGKHVRAEPVAALYEQGRVRHVRVFDELESQLMNFTRFGYLGDRSPNNADALVWAISELAGDDSYDASFWAKLAN